MQIFAEFILILLPLLHLWLNEPKAARGESDHRQTFPEMINDSITVLTELRKGDILVKPNHNWLPGSIWVEGGNGFGHAAIVVEGASGKSAMEVLEKTVIFESHSRDVPAEFQLRQVYAYSPGTDFRYANITFAPVRTGVMYRLRPDLREEQIDSLVAFVLQQDNGLSSWRAIKSAQHGSTRKSNGNRTWWYCSHLIREAFLHVTGSDPDGNGGVIVYPNDLIGSDLFKNDPAGLQRRVRF